MTRRFVLPLVTAGFALAGDNPQTAADPTVRGGLFLWFQLNETMQEVSKRLGMPRAVADFGSSRTSWQYYLDEGSAHDPSHFLVFRNGRLVSVSRSYEPERTVDEFFPQNETRVFFLPTNPGFGARARKLPGGRILLAPGSEKRGKPAGQLLLITDAELALQYPWVYGDGTTPRNEKEVNP